MEILRQGQSCLAQCVGFGSCGFRDLQILNNLIFCVLLFSDVLGCADEPPDPAGSIAHRKSVAPHPTNVSIRERDPETFVRRAAGVLLITPSHEFEVTGEAENGQVAIREAERLRPDLIVLDLSISGLPVTQQESRNGDPDLVPSPGSVHSGYTCEATKNPVEGISLLLRRNEVCPYCR